MIEKPPIHPDSDHLRDRAPKEQADDLDILARAREIRARAKATIEKSKCLVISIREGRAGRFGSGRR